MCLASTPPVSGSKTILGSDSAPGGGFDSAPGGFSGLNASDQGFNDPGFSPPPHRRGTLLTSPPEPDFGELGAAPVPFAQKGLSAPPFDVSESRELDIAPASGVVTSAVPAFAPPRAVGAAPTPKLPKPALARGSVLTRTAQSADLSAPSSPPAPAAPPIAPRPAARPAIAATKLDPPARPVAPITFPAEDAAAGSGSGNLPPDSRPSIETAGAEGFDLGGFEETDTLGAVDTPSGLIRFLDFTRDFDDTDLAITSEIVGLDPERTALLRDILRASDIADEDGVADIENAAAGLRTRIAELTDTGRNDRARFEQFLDGAVRASGIPGAVRRGSGTMADGILKSEGHGLLDVLRENPVKVAATVTGAGLGARIGRVALAPLIRERTLSPQALAASAARVRAGLTGKEFSNTRRALNKIDAGNADSQIRNAVVHLLDGAVPSDEREKRFPNFDKAGGFKAMKADFEALIRNAGGEPGKREPLPKFIGERIDLLDGTKAVWRLTENEGLRTIEIQIEKTPPKKGHSPRLKIRYNLDR